MLKSLGVNEDMSWTCQFCNKLILPYKGSAVGHSCSKGREEKKD